jgi:hypothetical protein
MRKIFLIFLYVCLLLSSSIQADNNKEFSLQKEKLELAKKNAYRAALERAIGEGLQ